MGISHFFFVVDINRLYGSGAIVPLMSEREKKRTPKPVSHMITTFKRKQKVTEIAEPFDTPDQHSCDVLPQTAAEIVTQIVLKTHPA